MVRITQRKSVRIPNPIWLFQPFQYCPFFQPSIQTPVLLHQFLQVILGFCKVLMDGGRMIEKIHRTLPITIPTLCPCFNNKKSIAALFCSVPCLMLSISVSICFKALEVRFNCWLTQHLSLLSVDNAWAGAIPGEKTDAIICVGAVQNSTRLWQSGSSSPAMSCSPKGLVQPFTHARSKHS